MSDKPNPELAERLALFNDYTYPQLAESVLAAQTAYAEAKAISNRLNDELQFLLRQVIPSRMDRDQIQNITVNCSDGIQRKFVVLSQVGVKTPADKKQELWNWLREHDAKELISETVNSSTLAAYVREQMKNGEPYPADICEINMYEVASLRKA